MSTEPQFTRTPSPPRPYSAAQRVGYGLLWTFWTGLLVIVGFQLLFGGASALGGLIALGLGALTGRYTWRIWTWQARRLIFFIIF